MKNRQVSYTALYAKACFLWNRQPNYEILSELSNYEISFWTDSVHDQDISALVKVIPKFTSIRRIHLWGKAYKDISHLAGTSDLGGTLPRPSIESLNSTALVANSPNNKSPKHYPNSPKTDRNSVLNIRSQGAVSDKVTKIWKSLRHNLKLNCVMNEIKLVGCQIEYEGWSALGQGLKHSTSMRYLTINFCGLTDPELEALADGFGYTLRKVDLSNNCLSLDAGKVLGQVIKKHGGQKDKVVWTNGLRSNQLNPCRVDGLVEMNLGNNNLCDQGACDLAEVLVMDRWLTGLDLRHNGITDAGLDELQQMLMMNKSMLYLDVAGNSPAENFVFEKKILDRVRGNIRSKSKVSFVNPAFSEKLEDAYSNLNTSLNQSFNASQNLSPKRSATMRSSLKSSPVRSSTRKATHSSVSSIGSIASVLRSMESGDKKLRPKRNRSRRRTQPAKMPSPTCQKCTSVEDRLSTIEKYCQSITHENVKLKQQIKSLVGALNPGQQPEQTQEAEVQEEKSEQQVIDRIEVLMTELTKLVKIAKIKK